MSSIRSHWRSGAVLLGRTATAISRQPEKTSRFARFRRASGRADRWKAKVLSGLAGARRPKVLNNAEFRLNAYRVVEDAQTGSSAEIASSPFHFDPASVDQV
jgi:hypothetical protein